MSEVDSFQTVPLKGVVLVDPETREAYRASAGGGGGTSDVNVTNTSLPVNNGGTALGVSLASVPTHPVTQSGTWTVTSTPAIAVTSPALTPFRNINLLNTPVAVKTGAGRVHQYFFHNENTSTVYVHIFNATVANITPGTTNPAITLAIPAGSSLQGYWNSSHAWSTAISILASTAANGSGAPTTGIIASLGYI